MPRPDLYISADVETDGPIPGPYSMLSFGLAVAASYDGTTVQVHDPVERTFYAELKPISEQYDAEAAAVSGLDREALIRDGRDPAEAMTAAAAWVREVAGDARPILAAYPASFDWMWLYWYFMSYADSPFGFSGCLDMKTYYAARAQVPYARANKRSMPAGLLSDRPHTHNALDDAIEQADLLANLLSWQPDRSGAAAR